MTQEEMAVKLEAVDQRSKSNTHRLDNTEKRLDDAEKRLDDMHRMATAMEVMAAEQKHQTEDMKEIKTDVASLGDKVEAIEQKPAKRWDGMMDKIVTALVAALVGFVLAKIGMG